MNRLCVVDLPELPSFALPGISIPFPGLPVFVISLPSVNVNADLGLDVDLSGITLPSFALPGISVPLPGLPTFAINLPSISINADIDFRIPEIPIPSFALPGIVVPLPGLPVFDLALPGIGFACPLA